MLNYQELKTTWVALFNTAKLLQEGLFKGEASNQLEASKAFIISLTAKIEKDMLAHSEYDKFFGELPSEADPKTAA